jgi:hypothetical protein
MKTKKREFYVGVRLSLAEYSVLQQIAASEDISVAETFRLILRNEARLHSGVSSTSWKKSDKDDEMMHAHL